MTSMTDEEFSNFCQTPEFIARAPAGKLDLLGTGTIYVDGAGRWLDREAYQKAHGVDPEPLWQDVKRYREMVGKDQAVQVLGMQPRIRRPPVRLGRY